MQQVAALHLPAMYQFPEEAEEGGFVAYGPSIVQIFQELVTGQVVNLFRGVKPADIPNRAADQVRASDQPQDRECARRYGARDIAGTRRQGDRIR
jgi:hypothetical protein